MNDKELIDDREALAHFIDKKLDGDCGYGVGEYLASAILAAGFSRAAVPDAATEKLRDASEADRIRLGHLQDEVYRLEAERDAALAAVERVRAINTGNNRALYGNDFEAGMAKALWLVKTALDGAPEPEWEVQYGRRNRETGALHWLTGDPRDDWWHENQDRYEHVKRYTSPPLPVEGENDD